MPESLRPPAVPLLTVDPFFSVWSFADILTDDVTRHWTGAPNSLLGLIRIDGCAYRFLGLESEDRSMRIGELPAMPQKKLTVTATQTIYRFEAAGVALEVRFTAPLLLDDLAIASRPVNYLTLSLASLDGRPHQAACYLDMTGELCSDKAALAKIAGSTTELAGCRGVRLFNDAEDAGILASSGDDQRINWGSVHLLPLVRDAAVRIASANLRLAFAEEGRIDLPALPARNRWPESTAPLVGAACVRLDLDAGRLNRSAALILAYDDQASIDYFGRRTPAYCFKDGLSFAAMISSAASEYRDLLQRCDRFDVWLADAGGRAGGAQYAELAALAYRQAIAAHKIIADEEGQVVFLSKECFSNGCIGTVDVSYPSTPLFLLLCPELVRGMLRPIFRFAASPRWPFDYAPHDVGQYPLATGQVYGLRNGQFEHKRQMPVEECGNMLIMTAAACRADGNFALARANLALLERWAGYLQTGGQDPDEQLCTDDFAGHLNHNANLSVKAIIGLGAYALILEACGEGERAAAYRRLAAAMAARWQEMAADGDHTRLTFDRPATWSMKYNLLFDRLLNLNLFPAALGETEIDAYLRRQNRYGLPLDSRAAYTKSDWLVWCAALSDDPAKVASLIGPLYRYYCETGSRMPMTDWYDTITGRALHFRNRSVIGGLFALMLKDRWLNS